jgi:CRP/FNR family transcriptional regulator
MIKKNAVEAFSNIFFGTPDPEILGLISDISRMVSVKKREMLFFEGDEGRHLYYMSSGSIKLFKSSEDGKEAIIRFIEPGDHFAEIILFLKNRYPVNAMAIKPSKLLAVDAVKLFDFIKGHPEMAMKLIGKLASKSQYLVRMVESLTLADIRKRFLDYLRHLKEKSGADTVTLPVPKGELSMLLGASPETFSRLLRKLTEEGIIDVAGKKITILKGLG